ncbi:aspartate/glutamate racemase family protein [Caulobacter sp. S45]|uniref:aspartate/glutamate racemase family protein n=1 Tax=Caulobacter sp. S45 TaxID=1641861 RepID=UPI00131A8B5C|nr:aspartate/glutamate racemase family protein [Caulobacter sp. S45]
MKTIGLLGGMSWESSALYYQLINERVAMLRGGFNSAKCVMYSVNFQEVETYQAEGRWEDAGELLADAAARIRRAGAEIVVLCTNTMHKVADYIVREVGDTFIHIAEPTAQAIHQREVKTIGLLGTRYTMEQDFYKGKLAELGVSVLVPPAEDRDIVHSIIYDELCRGEVKDSSRAEYQRIIRQLQVEGGQGVILGCTEIGMLIGQRDVDVPVFDTTQLHAHEAVRIALGAG